VGPATANARRPSVVRWCRGTWTALPASTATGWTGQNIDSIIWIRGSATTEGPCDTTC